MRKIEQQMVQAVESRRNWAGGNIAVTIHPDGSAHVTLHGNLIAVIGTNPDTYYNKCATLAGWPTPTTRSRLRALGFNVYQHNNCQMAGSIEVRPNVWFCETCRGYAWCASPTDAVA